MQIKKIFNEEIIRIAALVITLYFLVLLLITVSGFLGQFTWLMSALIMAVIIALIVKPIKDFFEKLGLSKGLSISLGYLVFFAIISVIVFLLLPPLVEELNKFLGPGIKQLKEHFPSLDPINNFLKQFNSNASISVDQITKPLIDNLGNVVANLGSIATNVLGIMIQFILGFIFSTFLIADGKKFSKHILKLTPGSLKDDYRVVVNALIDGFRSFIKFQGISAFAYAAIVLLLMNLFGYDYVLICTVLSFLAFLIPGIGAPIALIPPLVLGLLFKGENITLLVVLIVILLVVQNFILNYLMPKFYGKKFGIHPALVLIVILVSLQVFGILGVIVAIPVASAIQQVIANFILNNSEKMQKEEV
jgi:predicted PurR-regulated permease PerM